MTLMWPYCNDVCIFMCALIIHPCLYINIHESLYIRYRNTRNEIFFLTDSEEKIRWWWDAIHIIHPSIHPSIGSSTLCFIGQFRLTAQIIGFDFENECNSIFMQTTWIHKSIRQHIVVTSTIHLVYRFTHWSLKKMDDILQTTFLKTFSPIPTVELT